eukprot:UN06725
MQIKVKTMMGEIIMINCDPSDSVDVLKEMIHWEKDIPPEQQRLIFNGKQLDDGRTIADYGVHRDSVLHLVLRLRG